MSNWARIQNGRIIGIMWDVGSVRVEIIYFSREANASEFGGVTFLNYHVRTIFDLCVFLQDKYSGVVKYTLFNYLICRP